MPKKKENLSPEERLIKAVIPKEEEPYTLPDNWVWTRLENISEKITDGAHKTPTYVKEGIPFISVKDIRNNEIFFDDTKFITLEEHKELYKRCNPEKGDVLVTKSGTIGRTAVVKDDFEFSLFVSVALIKNIKNVINSNFLSYAMQDFINKIDVSRDIKGGVIKNYHISDMKKQLVPLPPFDEQKRIVEKLDSLFEKTGKIKEIIEEVKEKTSLRREAVLSKAFTGELTEKWRVENKTENAKELLLKINEEKLKNNPKTKIKDVFEMLVNEDEIPYKVPENWVWTRLEDIFRVERGGSPRPIKDFLVDSIDGINWIKIGDTELGKKYINSTKEKIKKEGIKKSRYVKKGDLLLTNSMSFGRAYILNCDGCIHDGWLVLQPEFDKISREYFYYLLNSCYMYLVFSELAKGSTVKNLNKDIVKTVAISLPPIEEQKEIVRILDKVFEEENKISELISLEEKVEILEKTILDKAFRGELGTGNTDDEPAIELLKRALEENK